MTYPVIVFWMFFVWSLFASRATVLSLLFASLSFGSLAVFPPEMMRGTTVLPCSMFAIVLIAKAFIGEQNRIVSTLIGAARLRSLGFLLLFLAVGIAATVLMPRLFSGRIVIIPMRIGYNLSTEYLEPTQANVTQAAYLTLSVAVAFSTAILAKARQFQAQLLSAVLLGGAVAAATGLVDFAFASAGLGSVLEPFRNASYSLMTNADVHGVRRVVGLMPEASTYGVLCLSLASALAFLRPLYPSGPSRFLAALIALALACMALLSTSSAAYAGVAIFGVAYAINWLRRFAQPSAVARDSLGAEFGFAFVLAILALLIWIVHSEVFDPLLAIINEIIFNKAMSGSFYERSFWNAVGWNTVVPTYGLGVGIGGTRTSSWFIAVLSNTGILGAAFMAVFLIQTFLRRVQPRTASSIEMMTALKFAIIPQFAMSALGVPTPDFGLWLGLMLGAITGMAGLDQPDGSISNAKSRFVRPGYPLRLSQVTNRAQ